MKSVKQHLLSTLWMLGANLLVENRYEVELMG